MSKRIKTKEKKSDNVSDYIHFHTKDRVSYDCVRMCPSRHPNSSTLSWNESWYSPLANALEATFNICTGAAEHPRGWKGADSLQKTRGEAGFYSAVKARGAYNFIADCVCN
jgi:hypothetical protein